MRRFGWVAVATVTALFFAAVLWETVARSAPEMDLWWHVPSILEQAQGRSLLGKAVTLLQPGPRLFNQPTTKVLPWLIHGGLGWSYASLVLMGILFHAANSGLIFQVGRCLGFSRRSSFLAALIYGTLFVHFHAYLWPMAIQHVVGVFCLLLIFLLYQKTEERIEAAQPAALPYALALLAAIPSSLQRSSLFVLLLIVGNLTATGKGPRERGESYDRWIPLFLLYPLCAIWENAFVGDRVTTTLISESPLPPATKAGLLFAVLLGCVAAGRWLIRLRSAPRLLAAGLGVGFLLLFPWTDRREILFPYNALGPFATVLGSFLDPFRAALQIDSTREYHYIPAQISGLALVLAVLLWAYLGLRIARGAKRLWVLVVWYAVCMSYVLLHRHVSSSFPLQLVSRYYIYFTPLVAWILSECIVSIGDLWARGCGVRRALPGALLGAGVLLLCFANALAVPVAAFRGRLVNTYGIYDDIRVAHLIRDELGRRLPPAGRHRVGRGGPVIVNGMVPLTFNEELARDLAVERVHFENFRIVARDAWRGLPVGELRINESGPHPEGSTVFQMAGTRLEDSTGQPVDPFVRALEQGLSEYAQGNRAQALRLLEQAVETRPFLLRYLLGGCRPADLLWITGGRGLREWLEELNGHYETGQSVEPPKRRAVAAVLRGEVSDYALCLLYLSYLQAVERRGPESERWVSELRTVEPDPGFLVAWLGRRPEVNADPELRDFMWGLANRPFPPEARGGLPGFLMRLVLHREIPVR